MRIAALGLLALLTVQPSSPLAERRARVEAWTSANQRAVVAELAALLEIPNVAADRVNIVRNVAFLEAAFGRRRFTTRPLCIHTE